MPVNMSRAADKENPQKKQCQNSLLFSRIKISTNSVTPASDTSRTMFRITKLPPENRLFGFKKY